MKKLLQLCILMISCDQINAIPFAHQLFNDETCKQFACEHSCDCKAVSHSFFSIRPVYTINSPEYLAHNRDYYKTCLDVCSGTVQITPLGGASSHNESVSRFFLPFCDTTLVVTEQSFDETNILARNFNIYTKNGTFQSSVEFKPHHTFAGVGINYQQRIYQRCNGNSIWISISGPILHVRNRMELIEDIYDDGGGPITVTSPAPQEDADNLPNSCNSDCMVNPTIALQPVGSVEEAFKQKGWCFGRIDPSQGTTKTGIGDITVRLGYETVFREDCHLDSFFGLLIPTGNTPSSIILFEPIIGHNRHWGIVLGTTFGTEIWQAFDGDLILSTEFDFSITELFEHTERRSFDLKNKPWSRYMQFYKNKEQAELAAANMLTDPTFALTLHTPGIDILTQDVKIKPGFYRMFNAGFILDYCQCLELEFGYNFFARQSECIHLACALPTDVAPKAIALGAGATSRFASINDDVPNACVSPLADYENNVITEADLNLESAAHPATITHTVYGSLAVEWNSCDHPMFVAVGASYEFPPDNVGLNRWMVWGKYGIAF